MITGIPPLVSSGHIRSHDEEWSEIFDGDPSHKVGDRPDTCFSCKGEGRRIPRKDASLKLLIQLHAGIAPILAGIKGEARDGKVAVRKAHELNPDVVLMEISMPGLSGRVSLIKYAIEQKVIRIPSLLSRH